MTDGSTCSYVVYYVVQISRSLRKLLEKFTNEIHIDDKCADDINVVGVDLDLGE